MLTVFTVNVEKAATVNMVVCQATNGDTTFVNVGDMIVVHRHFAVSMPAQFYNAYYQSVSNKIFQLSADYNDGVVKIHTVSDSVCNITILSDPGFIESVSGITYSSQFYIKINATITGIHNLSKALNMDITVYPNPAPSNSEISIKFDIQETTEIKIKMFSITGQLVVDDKVTLDESNNKYKLNLFDVAASMYIVRVEIAGKFADKKLIVQ